MKCENSKNFPTLIWILSFFTLFLYIPCLMPSGFKIFSLLRDKNTKCNGMNIFIILTIICISELEWKQVEFATSLLYKILIKWIVFLHFCHDYLQNKIKVIHPSWQSSTISDLKICLYVIQISKKQNNSHSHFR